MSNFGFPRQTPWEKVFLYWPLVIDNKFYWWRWVERRVVIEYSYLGSTEAHFEWRLPIGQK